VAVSVARKMDAALWPALFDAVGPPDALAEGLLAAGQPVSAACCLLIVDRLQGAAKAQALALRNIQVQSRIDLGATHRCRMLHTPTQRCWFLCKFFGHPWPLLR
jgi:RIC1